MSEQPTPADLTAAIVRVLHNEGDGGIWEHFDRKNSEEVAATLAPALTAAGFGPVRAVEAERDEWKRKAASLAEQYADLLADIGAADQRAIGSEAREKALRESVGALLSAPYGSDDWGILRDGVRYIPAPTLAALLATSPDREGGDQ